MAVKLNLDELNTLERRLEYREYFAPMAVPTESRKKREKMADEIDDLWIDLLAIYMVAMQYNQPVDEKAVIREFTPRMEDILRENGVREEVIQNYVNDVFENEIDVTQRRYTENDYWVSDDRVREIVENDINIILNSQEYLDASASGKRYKRWITMRDDRVRDTHAMVDSDVVAINDPFVVGNSLMMFPGDVSLGAAPEEIVNCRCAVEYF